MREPVFNETLQLGIVVRDLEATTRRYENYAVPAVGLRSDLVEVRIGDGDMVDALALLGGENACQR